MCPTTHNFNFQSPSRNVSRGTPDYDFLCKIWRQDDGEVDRDYSQSFTMLFQGGSYFVQSSAVNVQPKDP